MMILVHVFRSCCYLLTWYISFLLSTSVSRAYAKICVSVRFFLSLGVFFSFAMHRFTVRFRSNLPESIYFAMTISVTVSVRVQFIVYSADYYSYSRHSNIRNAKDTNLVNRMKKQESK